MKGPARVLGQLDAGAGRRLYSPLEGLDRRVEVALGDFESRRLGLPDLFGDALVLSLERGVAARLMAHPGGVLLVLPRVGCDIAQDAHLDDIGVVFGIDALELRMQGLVAGAGQPRIALIDLDVGIALAEVDQSGKRFRFGSTYLRYVLS